MLLMQLLLLKLFNRIVCNAMRRIVASAKLHYKVVQFIPSARHSTA